MNDQNQRAEMGKPRHRARGYLRWSSGILALTLGLMLTGAIYESVAEASDARTYPPPGQLVDVGGYRLHINCTGTGSPTVVIDVGLSDWSTMWGFVQPEVAKTTRVCTYDRAGLGWSEAGPLPRDATQFAKELHALLQNAHIPGPYVMVGHSLGGLPVRVFVHDYSSEVAGVVLIESMNPKQFTLSETEAQSPSDSQSQPFSFLAGLARFGVVRLLVRPLGIVTYVPPNEKAYFSLYVRPQNIQAFTNENQGMPAAAAQAAAVKTFGDLPLIILTARLNNNLPGWQQWQTELLELSSNSQQMFAENSGHNIEIEEPEAAVAAIIQMVRQVRETATR
jgi:pimeloyl-ACP methyl ester carboxylesterase